ncbi:growth/differentiation factor 7 [Sceloporus undulatus]|uniref:growth/differentiation factor 7 n=1 Tax=Sceloporus undulatus TaxID=8520 RepID=UPI001C4BF25C|nr:growth/differentiation factor 7 [Sceloporus undulatus]
MGFEPFPTTNWSLLPVPSETLLSPKSSISLREEAPAAGGGHPSGRRFLFDLASLPEGDEVLGAELRVLRRAPPLPLTDGAAEGAEGAGVGGSPGGLLLDWRRGPPSDQGPHWEVFEVGAQALKEAAGPSLCLLLQAESWDAPAGRVLSVSGLGLGRDSEPPHLRALLVVFSRAKRKESLFQELREKARALGSAGSQESGRPKGRQQHHAPGGRRRRRTTLAGRAAAAASSSSAASSAASSSQSSSPSGPRGGQGKKSRSRCSRKGLQVNFKALGWDDWIIAPLDYEAFHCEGACEFPLRSHLEPTNHAIIQTLMHSMDPEAAPPSCCVPAKLSPISILYIDAGNNVVYKQYEDMVVEACGCR